MLKQSNAELYIIYKLGANDSNYIFFLQPLPNRKQKILWVIHYIKGKHISLLFLEVSVFFTTRPIASIYFLCFWNVFFNLLDQDGFRMYAGVNLCQVNVYLFPDLQFNYSQLCLRKTKQCFQP